MLNAICSASGRHIQRETDEPLATLKCSCGAPLLPAVWTGTQWAPRPADDKKKKKE